MRSSGRCAAAAALVAVLLSAAPHAQSSQAANLYQQARTREASLRTELDAGTASTAKSEDMLTRMRTLARTYEDLWRLFPTSPYSDDALWYGAMLAGDAFWQSGNAADRSRALRLLQALSANFPTSSLLKRVPPQIARLESAKPADVPVSATPLPGPPPQSVPAPRATPPDQTAVPAASARPSTTSTPSYAMLTAIRRQVLPDVVRVTLELEREPVFSSERIDGPPRVFIDMQNTRASDALVDASLPFKDDVVRQIRVGRQLNGRIRVVMDLSGSGKYSVYALYNPFRIVIDFDRKLPGTPPPVQQASIGVATPAAATPPPVGRTPGEPDKARPTGTQAAEANKPRPPSTESVAAATPAAAAPPPAGRTLSGPPGEPDRARPTGTPAAEANKPRLPSTESVAATTPTAAASPPVGRTLSGPPGEPDKARPTGTQAGEANKPRSTSPDVTPTAAAAKPRSPLGKGPEPGDSFTPPATVASPNGASAAPATAPATTTNPQPLSPSTNSTGAFSLSRQLGLGIARIVIDPGHGGHDPGAQVMGLSEAEVTLDIALRLEKLFTKQSGVQVVLTRRDDTFVPLQDRTTIANGEGADLFLSIHANANEDTSLRGVETYFLNLSPNPEAGRIAARENAASSKTMHDFADIVKAIALNDKIDESRDFATIVQTALYEKLRTSNRSLRNLGVKQAPFMVLIGATMPSILAEISFLTNKQDAALLKTEKYRQQIAEALYQGVMRYQQALKKIPAVAAR